MLTYLLPQHDDSFSHFHFSFCMYFNIIQAGFTHTMFVSRLW